MIESIQSTEITKPLPMHIQGIIEDLKSFKDGGKYLQSERLWMLAAQIDSIMPYRDGHLLRVAELSLKIGKALKLDEDQLRILEYSALFHDIGKLGISESLLYKDSPLSDEERGSCSATSIGGRRNRGGAFRGTKVGGRSYRIEVNSTLFVKASKNIFGVDKSMG